MSHLSGKIDKIFFWKVAYTYHKIVAHFAFIPKYRRRLLQGKIALRIRQPFFECSEVNSWFIYEMEVMPDHVHVLIQIDQKTSLSQVAMFLKGGFSKVLRKEFSEIKEFFWGDSFWADGYFVETSGRANEITIREYIKNQRNKEIGRSSGL
ncbi:MAG TPA: IS200/IS605 family transposase [bacterium]|jgi:putative transposase|nr:IS200/IS605 family transposase [bacterium]HNS34246.1 IS200/IS605 family transposase [bacterium]HNZ73307.1 IS200/IS605 family transposase [bacterium]HOH67416.1 IS200/IS605 family transposase [bacterium]HPN81281.1 IS200/IS605 family transposase [bacterium]